MSIPGSRRRESRSLLRGSLFITLWVLLVVTLVGTRTPTEVSGVVAARREFEPRRQLCVNVLVIWCHLMLYGVVLMLFYISILSRSLAMTSRGVFEGCRGNLEESMFLQVVA